ncbi:MAG TPA: polyphenol oxidase family protein, partial [Sumerlaeia bacterium]|nr:polyphenol oxidase family protein [Sumerlaeia bacterium]
MRPRLLSPAIFAATRGAVGPLDWLVCGMSTRHAVVAGESRLDLAARLPHLAGLSAVRVVIGEQAHGRRIAVIVQGDEQNGPPKTADQCAETEKRAAADPKVRAGVNVRVVEIPPGRKGAGSPVEIPGVDGLIVSDPGILVAVSTADCVPIVLADERARRSAVLHAGREGTRLGIVPNAIERLRDLGSRPQDMRVWIGPSISAAHYEVSRTIAEGFRAQFGGYGEIA